MEADEHTCAGPSLVSDGSRCAHVRRGRLSPTHSPAQAQMHAQTHVRALHAITDRSEYAGSCADANAHAPVKSCWARLFQKGLGNMWA
eukprot:6214697-Pleurochrysis_carterae.AAC.4